MEPRKPEFLQEFKWQHALPFSDCAFSPDESYLAGKLLSGHVLIHPSVPLEKIDLSELKKATQVGSIIKNTKLSQK